MCILVLLYHVAEDAPVVAGANREEFYQRGGEPPRLLEGPGPGGLRAVAGIDPVAGGTWFGVNSAGV
ncbi:MAG TPA: NRDE family protein, partial [Actinomycetota bacterium]|nr:NRDE family protein [Actinomycetota bacterium]